VKAARRILTDDGFNVGILYRGDRMVYRPPVGKGQKKPADLERGFEL
jgi:2-oxoglutarate ferredoxin oxidoreductase subunit beta